MLAPHIVGGSPVISRIMAHSRCASSRRCSSGTRARNSSTDASVCRIAGTFLAVMLSYSHSRLDPPATTHTLEAGYSSAAQLAGDDRALDLRGALVDARRPHLPVQVLEQV